MRKISYLGNANGPLPRSPHEIALTRKPSVCLAEVVRFQRPTRQRNSQKRGQGWMDGGVSTKYRREGKVGCGYMRNLTANWRVR